MKVQDAGSGDEVVTGMGITEYLRVARIYWKSIAAVALVVTVLVTLWGALQPRIYSAEASAVVLTVGSENVNTLLTGDALAKSKIKNYESIAESRLVADHVIESVGLNSTADALLPTITVSVPLDTAEIRISAKSPDPAMAQRVADAWINELAKRVQQLESSVVAGGPAPSPASVVGLVSLDKATLPSEPVSPNIKLALLFGAVGGLLLAFAAALLRHHLDRRLRSAIEIECLFKVPVIGTLPFDQEINGAAKILGVEHHEQHQSINRNHAFSEALRALRTNLKFLDVDNPPRVILITSSMSSEGKSTVVGNLAVTIAATGEPVIVVDGDLRRPRIAAAFNLIPGVGVTNVLSGQAKLADVIQAWPELPNLSILGSGPTPPNPSELLGSNAMKQMLNSLSAKATVLIDAPPLLPVTDAAVLSRAVDGVIVVARAGTTTRDELEKAFKNLQNVKAPVLGAIFNCVPTKGVDAYAYYGGYMALQDGESSIVLEEPAEIENLNSSLGGAKDNTAYVRSIHLQEEPQETREYERGPAAKSLEAS